MTPDEVRAVAFGDPRIGKRGYDKDEVNRLLGRIETTLRGQPQVTRAELKTWKFRRPPIGKRGYNEAEVEGFIRRVITEWPEA
jgi:DivIVA domain-containing protein